MHHLGYCRAAGAIFFNLPLLKSDFPFNKHDFEAFFRRFQMQKEQKIPKIFRPSADNQKYPPLFSDPRKQGGVYLVEFD